MSGTSHVRLMASYNEWMNTRLYAAAATLPAAALAADRRAFFGSIIGTLNHLANGDIIWLKRFATHPAGYAALAGMAELPQPASLGALQIADFTQLAALRRRLDAAITGMADAITEEDLEQVLSWTNSRGEFQQRKFFGTLLHFFNHQTHHRGQVTTLLSQEGVDMGSTDLIVLVPDEVAA